MNFSALVWLCRMPLHYFLTHRHSLSITNTSLLHNITLTFQFTDYRGAKWSLHILKCFPVFMTSCFTESNNHGHLYVSIMTNMMVCKYCMCIIDRWLISDDTSSFSCVIPCHPQWPHRPHLRSFLCVQLCMLPGLLCSLWLRPPHSLITAMIYSQYLRARTHKCIFKTCKLLPSIKMIKVCILVNSVPPNCNWVWFVSVNQMQVMFRALFQRCSKSKPGQVRIWWALRRTWYPLRSWRGPADIPMGLGLWIPWGSALSCLPPELNVTAHSFITT